MGKEKRAVLKTVTLKMCCPNDPNAMPVTNSAPKPCPEARTQNTRRRGRWFKSSRNRRYFAAAEGWTLKAARTRIVVCNINGRHVVVVSSGGRHGVMREKKKGGRRSMSAGGFVERKVEKMKPNGRRKRRTEVSRYRKSREEKKHKGPPFLLPPPGLSLYPTTLVVRAGADAAAVCSRKSRPCPLSRVPCLPAVSVHLPLLINLIVHPFPDKIHAKWLCPKCFLEGWRPRQF